MDPPFNYPRNPLLPWAIECRRPLLILRRHPSSPSAIAPRSSSSDITISQPQKPPHPATPLPFNLGHLICESVA